MSLVIMIGLSMLGFNMHFFEVIFIICTKVKQLLFKIKRFYVEAMTKTEWNPSITGAVRLLCVFLKIDILFLLSFFFISNLTQILSLTRLSLAFLCLIPFN